MFKFLQGDSIDWAHVHEIFNEMQSIVFFKIPGILNRLCVAYSCALSLFCNETASLCNVA